jgi:peptidoglycan/xylan/chitin deacetylase (PgdA/CDA1 family)
MGCARSAADPTPVVPTDTEVPPPSRTVDPSPTPSPAPPTATPPPPTATPVPQIDFGPGPVNIPILLYHHVTPGGNGPRYTVSAEAFEAQMAFLAEAGYQTVTISDVARAVRTGTRLPPRPIVLTFDDGNLDTYTEAWPRMRPHGFVGVAYIVANRVGSDEFLSADQLAELAAAGWEIGSHSMTHASLVEIERSQWRSEIIGSKLELERLLGIEVGSFAYPFGLGDADIFRKTAEYGYDSGVGLGKATVHDRGDLYYLNRREVLGDWDLAAFEAIFVSE